MLDSALQVNLKLWTTDIWQQLNLKKTLAGEDPEWRQKLIGGYTDCYQIASNWPQQSLDRNPITKVFGRHMIFFKCAMKQEKKMCGMAQMYSWLTTLYGVCFKTHFIHFYQRSHQDLLFFKIDQNWTHKTYCLGDVSIVDELNNCPHPGCI